MKLFLLVTLFSSLSYASQYTLDRTNKMGIRKVTTIEESRGHYIFDGKDLGTKLPAKVKTSWNAIKNPPARKPASSCWSGTFVYTVANGKKVSKRTGCSEGSRYGNLIGHIEAVREYAQGVK
ncbi:hypothetical protein DOM22_16920 [Bdellovibrio sp. ZAP7]|uniref:hypothetical protein n=1 Tax=Bdellovibrio sp. ZAP7 TaxID=2231053 RepID=UPI00115794D8|nr:hypothetical protein [Bdellovibrio sp. ZAP7]QDK46715.1 hypothetical protein DOM22_16920 [Bdellovibrio sp. ZAP7]